MTRLAMPRWASRLAMPNRAFESCSFHAAMRTTVLPVGVPGATRVTTASRDRGGREWASGLSNTPTEVFSPLSDQSCTHSMATGWGGSVGSDRSVTCSEFPQPSAKKRRWRGPLETTTAPMRSMR